MLGSFYVLLLFPPIVTAAVYTMMAVIVYRACYKIFVYEADATPDNKGSCFFFSLWRNMAFVFFLWVSFLPHKHPETILIGIKTIYSKHNEEENLFARH